MLRGSQLTIYANRGQKKGRQSVIDWILDTSTNAGIRGATAVECSEGVDSHGRFHAARFFELADEPVAVMVVADNKQIEALLRQLADGAVKLFYTRVPIEYGHLGEEEKDNEL